MNRRLVAWPWLTALLLTAPVLAAGQCGEPATGIAQIQGRGDTSPLVGQTVTVEGILTLDSRTQGGFQGFYLQQPDTLTDHDPATSEALFVYTRRQGGKPGQRLRLTGQVREFHGLTELADIRHLQACGEQPLPAAIELDLSTAPDFEALENMRVRLRHPVTIIDTYNLARYGELALAPWDPVVPTEYLAPGPELPAIQPVRLLLDDGRRQQHPRPLPWPPGGLTPERTLRAGDRVTNLEGVLDFRYGAWRLQPTKPPSFDPVNARPPAPARPSGPHVRVMTLNLENLFNGDGTGGGFPTPRGARSPEQFQAQLNRLVAALSAPDPDILALTELENDGYGATSAIAELVRALGPDWRYVATPGHDGRDAIRTGLLYRQNRVLPVGPAQRLTAPSVRPPVAQVFQRRDGVDRVRVVVPHLKSKSCRSVQGQDRDQGDGQGCYGQQRLAAAQAMLAWLEQLPDVANLAGTLITGDFNSYSREPPIRRFEAAGYTNAVRHFHPCQPSRCDHYTYRYKGQKGSLDHALVSPALMSRLIQAQTWNINADEPRALGYRNDGHGTTALPAPWRSSDHNPILTDLRL